ncbi:L-lactate permease [Allobranchiibius sp. CTAmp26]|uniref:L-lactate permease n=1 Tax=Allobranchiibius sp. CTAmp26 TaxID=2815214 RepID=UPI001AA1783B|nr:L-lactate permease [Allobranchiibius sp. CTAmp26]MBO1756342.1 L-lactate permease [Allobranchiibius sp. CTAmp26]
MYDQIFDPVNHSLGLSAIFAALPLLTVFVLLAVFKLAAQWAALIALAVSIVVAIAVYSMPVGQTFSAAGEGAAFGLFPIMWIVVNAIWVYTMSVTGGHFDVLRRSFASVSPDQRIQAILIAFCFGALLEALAGFGTPVAITSVMLLALGFSKIKAATVALVANTAPVAFGAIAVPITTLAKISNLPEQDLASVVGRQTPVLAIFVPLALVFMVDGKRGLKQTWPVALLGGAVFGVLQFLCSNYISIPLTDIVAALGSALAVVLFVRVWHPREVLNVDSLSEDDVQTHLAAATASAHAVELGGSRGSSSTGAGARRTASSTGGAANGSGSTGASAERAPDSRGDIVRAYAPYLIIIVVFSLAQVGFVMKLLAKGATKFAWPGLHIQTPAGKTPSAVTFAFGWLPAAGTLLLISGVITMIVLGVKPATAARDYLKTLDQLKWAILTVAGVLALAYVMNLSGQTITIGRWMAGAGGVFAFLAPILGWLGVAVTGSDTSSNALFGTLQVSAAQQAHLSPVLMTAANSSGGVLGKMVSPQNLAIAAASVGLAGQEGVILRKILGWTVGFLLFMCLLVYLQSTSVLSWMLP